MALNEGKKGFIVYCSWDTFLEELNDEQTGQWFKWMMAYTNDKNPDYPVDPSVRMACKMTQTILKNDLEKYREKVERFKKVGKQYKTTDKHDTEIGTDNDTEIATEIGGDIDKDKDKVIVKDKDKDINLKESVKEKADDESPTTTPTPSNEIKPSKEQKHRYGEYGQVLLTNSEYERLCEKYGEGYIIQVIQALDESKKMTGNKNKWKDDNLVIQKAIREEWSMLKNIDPYKTPKSMKDEEAEREALNQKVDLSFLD